jgi:hypothetical protein
MLAAVEEVGVELAVAVVEEMEELHLQQLVLMHYLHLVQVEAAEEEVREIVDQEVPVVPVSSSSHTLHKYLKNHNDIYKGHQ